MTTEVVLLSVAAAIAAGSDGGLFACVCEMAFAGRCAVSLDLGPLAGDPLSLLFNEELGAVVQIRSEDRAVVQRRRHGFIARKD